MEDRAMLQMAEELAVDYSHQHSTWSRDIFDSFVTGRLRGFVDAVAIEGQADRRVVYDFLKLICEGIGCGYLGRSYQPYAQRWNNLLEAFVCSMDPASQEPSEIIATFVEVWNLNEGLLRQPEWMNAYVMTALSFPRQWSKVHGQLAEVLTPVLTTSTPADWSQPLRTSVVSADHIDRDFLPGEITPIAPRVVAVRDRRRETDLGLLLQEQGESLFLGPLSDVMPMVEGAELPEVKGEEDVIQVGEQTASAPYFDEPLTTAVLSSGFAVATTRNSQRVWVVESVR